MTPVHWIFDLDNTLHHASVAIFPHLNRAMTHYLMRYLALDEAAANALRQRYWRHYGVTLLGLIRHHRIDPRHFLAETHRFPNLTRMVYPVPRLIPTLRKLPGRKIIFTNAPRTYAQAVLDLLALTPLISRVVAIEDLGYHPKPRRRAYARLLALLKIPPSRAIFIEDTALNLPPAKQLGMTTVWISRARGFPPYVDWKLPTVAALPRILGLSPTPPAATQRPPMRNSSTPRSPLLV
ncbi:MAG: pyrimidine 5'-nucleotidase [Hydrogenophilus sp.]|nr:pyrimidine 5'-nucleotidase [Hydrogenophilus sp.]